MSKDVYVVPHQGDWAARRAGSTRVSKSFDTKAKAFAYGRNLARASHSELRVLNRDGRIGTCNSYGNDPHPPHDKNR